MNKIYALSIRQPWAELILEGRKKMELRSWSTDYRGRLWVHTGRKSDLELERFYGFTDLFKGGYLGVADLTDVIPLTPQEWENYRTYHLDIGSFQSGYFGWLLDLPRRFRAPILGSGKLGLYYPEEEIEESLVKAYSSLD